MRSALVVVLAGGMVLGGMADRAARGQAPAAASADSVADRSKELNALFNEIWEDRLKH